MADLSISVDIDATGTKTGAEQAKSAIKGIGDEAVKTGQRTRGSIAGIDFQRISERLKAIGPQIQAVGQQMQSVGTTLTGVFTLPLTALATLGVKAALELDTVRTKITALVGDSEKANAKIAELRDLASRSVGVTQAAALETFSQLKGIGDIADESINKVIGSMGKLNAAFKVDDQAGFMRNLVQIFSQGFEIADIKEAIGRVPIFRQLLEQAFGTDDPTKLKQLKEAGALTLDSFLTGLSDAINTDPRTANIGENLSTKLAKGMERLNVALAPLGQIILDAVVPIVERVTPMIENLGKWFGELSKPVQTAIVAFGALIAALGPVLFIVGGVVVAIGSIVSALGAIAGAVAAAGGLATLAPILAGIAVVMAVVAAYAAVLWAAWQTNFGGIRDLTATVAAAVEEAWNAMLEAIGQLTEEVLAEVSKFWAENGTEIMAAIQAISDFYRAYWTAIVEFFRENQETIKSIASAVWTVIKTLIIGAIQNIGSIIKLTLAIINGDWAKAWEATKELLSNVVKIWHTILQAGAVVVIGAVKLLFQAIWNLHVWVYQQATELGSNVGKGLYDGILKWVDPIGTAGRWLGRTVVDAISGTVKTQSPSKVTFEIGEFIAQGLADGMASKVDRVKASAKKLADETIKQLKDAAAEFAKLAGASPDRVMNVIDANRFQKATSNQQEIIKLRSELGENFDKPLPTTTSGTSQELRDLQAKKKAADDLWASLDQIGEWYKTEQNRINELNLQHLENLEKIRQSGEISVLNMHEEIKLIGVTDQMERLRIQNYFDIQRLREQLSNDGFGQKQIDEAVELTQVEQARRLELEKILDIRKQVAAAGNLGEDLVGQLETLRLGNRELSEYERILRQINQDYKDISPEQREYLLGLAKQIDAQKAYDEQFEKTREWIRGTFDILLEKGRSWGDKLKAIFGGIADKFRNMLLDMATNWLSSKIMGGGQGSGGGGLGGILSGLFGGGSGSGVPPTGTINANGEYVVNGNQGINPGGFFGNFGKGGFSMAGLGSSASALFASAGPAALVGLFMSSLSETSLLKGALKGGLVGFIAAIINRSKLRRKEEQIRNQGMLDAFAELKKYDALINDVRTLRIDPASGIAQGEQLGSTVRGNYMAMANALKDKKTRNIAIKDVARVDTIISEKMALLRSVAEVAGAAGERDRRMLPEFAGGVFMSPEFQNFRRQNGMLAGAWTGRDTIPAMLAQGEMVLNPMQQQRVKAAAGFDVFKPAGIPGYAEGGMVQRSQPMAPIAMGDTHVTVYVEQDADGMWHATAESDKGQKTIAKVVARKYANEELPLKRRGV